MTHGRIALLGGGNMGRALIGGLLRSGTRAERVSIGEHVAEARSALAQELGITATADNAQAVAGAAIVVLAVKPQDARRVLLPLAAVLRTARPLLISICAGTRVESLQEWTGGALPVVRAMPNRPALLGAGVTGMYAPPAVSVAQRSAAEQVMQAVGEVVWVPDEDLVDVVTAVSGSGPAYFFLLAQLMAEAGEGLGLERQAAQRLAAATLYGAGLMAHVPGADLSRLRAEVTSPSGTTEAAVRVLEAGDLRGTIARALAAATARGRELAMLRPDPDPAGT
ncbi:MAG: pyrroline-5-carboxylate reductase [Proteobacteria bacterium]|nr:pyrroline-5-carboxylate reductase [Pseudomonadota bacterium]